ncbi:MAG: AI-2E family transporter [Geobacteraceae bacterium GWB2_52_12]|nr:MAG: AI-2E family transporter [Geobacteraceae bacterium GWB2_52_12]
MNRTLFSTLLVYTFTLLLIYLLFTILSPFLAILVWAGAIGSITHPIYESFLVRCRGRENCAAALMTTAVVLSLILPLVAVISTLSREAALAYTFLESSDLTTGGFLQHPAISIWLDKFSPMTGIINIDLDAIFLSAIKNVVGSMLNYSTGIVKNFLGFLIKLVLMVITLFFIYRDGARFLERFWEVAGLGFKLQSTIVETISRVLGAVMYGIILTCMVQGMLGGLGFWVAGLPSPMLFGTLMAICAPIPLVGTALVWLPGVIYLLLQGHTLTGILLIAWCVLVVSSIDNIIRPLFISGRAKLHILIIVFGVFGGLMAFGITGVVAGPVILALFLVFFEVYRDKMALSMREPLNVESLISKD